MRVLNKRSSLSMKGFNLVFFVLCLVIQPLYEKRVEMVVSLTRANQGEGEVFHGCGEILELPKSPVPLETPVKSAQSSDSFNFNSNPPLSDHALAFLSRF